MKVHETRSHAHASGNEEKIMTRKQKAESKGHEAEHSPKKFRAENDDDAHTNGKSAAEVAAEYDDFCKAINEHLSVDQMRQVLQVNGLDSSGSDLEITRIWLENYQRTFIGKSLLHIFYFHILLHVWEGGTHVCETRTSAALILSHKELKWVSPLSAHKFNSD